MIQMNYESLEMNMNKLYTVQMLVRTWDNLGEPGMIVVQCNQSLKTSKLVRQNAD